MIAKIRENRAALDRLRTKFPIVWHIDYSLLDYADWLMLLTRNLQPAILDLTVVCLAVRAATDMAEFDWRSRAEPLEIEEQIKDLIPAVEAGLKFVEGRRGLSLDHEQARSLYEQHIKTNLSILNALVEDAAREDRAAKASILRKKEQRS